MDAEYYLKTEYALSNRSQCRGCKKKIENKILRIAYVIDVDQNYHSEKWYHIDCFDSLPKPVRNVNVTMIHGYDSLQSNDKKQIRIKMDELQSQPTGKKRVQSQKKKSVKIEKKQKDEDQEEEDQEQKKDKLNTKNVKKSSKSKKQSLVVESDQSYDQSDSYEDELEKDDGYTDKEWQIYQKNYDMLQSKTAVQLKQMLKLNDQPMTGSKQDLLERAADCMSFGSIPKCTNCNGGRLRFNKETGKFKCPGFMEDTQFIHCGKVFNKDQVHRAKWQDL